MARSSRIRWTKNDARTVVNLVRQFNAKITRVSRRNPSLAGIQPERINSQAIQEMLKQMTRRDFNRWLGRTRRYLEKGAELPYTTKQGVDTTVWQFRETTNDFRSINAKRRAELKRLNPSTITGTMGAIEQLQLRPRKNTIQEVLPKDWKTFIANIERQTYSREREIKSSRYQQNYIQAIRNEMGYQPELEDLVRQIDPMDLYDLYAANPLVQIDFVYAPEEIEEKVRLISEELRKYIDAK